MEKYIREIEVIDIVDLKKIETIKRIIFGKVFGKYERANRS